MKWLEGWFGTASGVLGIVWMALVGLLTPVSTPESYGSSGPCVSSSGGVTQCASPDAAVAPGPNVGLLIIFGVIILLYLGVLAGTWLDLRGARRVGRIMLLASATLLIFAPIVSLGALGALGAPGGIAGSYAYLLTFLAIVAGILASVRRDAPAPIAQG